MRPIFFGASMDPPAMDVLIPAESKGDTYRIVRGMRIRANVSTLEEASAAGILEVRAFTAEQVELLREVAVPITREEVVNERQPVFAVDVLERVAKYSGPVFCPACCRRLGFGDSPAIGYLTSCPGCHRPLNVTTVDGELVVIVKVVTPGP